MTSHLQHKDDHLLYDSDSDHLFAGSGCCCDDACPDCPCNGSGTVWTITPSNNTCSGTCGILPASIVTDHYVSAQCRWWCSESGSESPFGAWYFSITAVGDPTCAWGISMWVGSLYFCYGAKNVAYPSPACSGFTTNLAVGSCGLDLNIQPS